MSDEFSDVGVCVDAYVAGEFLKVLRRIDPRPDRVTRDYEGSIIAVWQDERRFDPFDPAPAFGTLQRFVEDHSDHCYLLWAGEGWAHMDIGNMRPLFGWRTQIEEFYSKCEPVDLDAVQSDPDDGEKHINPDDEGGRV